MRPMVGDTCSTAKEAPPRGTTPSSTPEPSKPSESHDWGTSKDRELKEMMEREKRERQERWQREQREIEPDEPDSPDHYDDEFEEDLDPLSPQKAVELKSEPSGIYDEEEFEDGSLDEYMQQVGRDDRLPATSDVESVSEESERRGPPPRPETSMGGHGDRAEYSMDYSSPSAHGGYQESLQPTRPFEPGELAVDEFYRIVDESLRASRPEALNDGQLVAPDTKQHVVM